MKIFNRCSKMVVLAVCLVVASHAAIIHTKTNFYKNLEMGIPQKFLVIGSSVSSTHWANYWPMRLANALNARFQNNVSYVNMSWQGTREDYLLSKQNDIAAAHPDVVIYEVCTGVPTANVSANLRSIIHQTRVNLPNADILFWCPWPTPNHTNDPVSIAYDTCKPYMARAKLIAMDSSIHWVDTWPIMDSIYRADPSGTCFANRNLNTFSCPQYSQYLFDGYHASVMCGDSIILPWIIKTLRGRDLIDTTTVSEPDCAPFSGEYSTPQTVTISCVTDGATIRYTTDGSVPTSSSPIYSAPIAINQTTILKVQAFKTGKTSSPVASLLYSIRALAPTFSPYPSGYTVTPTPVTLSCVTSPSTIRYTTDGSEPTKTNGTIYSNPIPVTKATLIKAVAYSSTLDASKTARGLYFISDSIITDSSTYTSGVAHQTPVYTSRIPRLFSPSSVWNKMVLEFDVHDLCEAPAPGAYLGFILFDAGTTALDAWPAQSLMIGHENNGYESVGATSQQTANVWKMSVGKEHGKSYFLPKPLPFLPAGFDVSYKVVFSKLSAGRVELSYKIINGQEEWGPVGGGPVVDTISKAQWDQIVAANGRNLLGVAWANNGTLSIKNIRVTRMRDSLIVPVQKVIKTLETFINRITQNTNAFIIQVGEQGKHSVAVYDVIGKVVFTAMGTGNHQYIIPRKSMSNGVYLMQIIANDKVLIKTLTKCVE